MNGNSKQSPTPYRHPRVSHVPTVRSCWPGDQHSQANAPKPAPRQERAQTDNHRGWYKYDRLPHFDAAGVYQSITYRLDDSLPRSALEQLEQELARFPRTEKRTTQRRLRIEALLDAGHGSCILRRPHNAARVMDAWRHFDGKRYDVIIGVVMPNHVHVLVRIYPGSLLADVINAWKSFTSRRFEADGTQTMPHWQRSYWDRFIRNDTHFERAVEYIAYNPVTAGLAKTPEDWPYLLLGRGMSI